MVLDRLAPILGGRLASHAHYLKEGGFWEKYVGEGRTKWAT